MSPFSISVKQEKMTDCFLRSASNVSKICPHRSTLQSKVLTFLSLNLCDHECLKCAFKQIICSGFLTVSKRCTLYMYCVTTVLWLCTKESLSSSNLCHLWIFQCALAFLFYKKKHKTNQIYKQTNKHETNLRCLSLNILPCTWFLEWRIRCPLKISGSHVSYELDFVCHPLTLPTLYCCHFPSVRNWRVFFRFKVYISGEAAWYSLQDWHLVARIHTLRFRQWFCGPSHLVAFFSYFLL